MKIRARKTLQACVEEAFPVDGSGLRRSLGFVGLTAFGVGSTVGAGIFSLTGQVAAHQTGPAVSLAFVLAGGGARGPVAPYSSSEKREVKGGITTRTRERQAASALRESLEALGGERVRMHDELNSTGYDICAWKRYPDLRSVDVRDVSSCNYGSAGRA